MKIKKIFSPKISYKNSKLSYRVAAFLLFFILFTVIISSDLFDSALNVELGKPSPELITAPFDKEIEDLTTYHEKQEAAAGAVNPVYVSDQYQIALLSTNLSQSFSVLTNLNKSEKDTSQKIKELHKNSPFSILPDDTLLSLLGLSQNELAKAEQIANNVIIGLALDTNSGAKTSDEVSLLKGRMKDQINKSSLAGSMKTFIQAFIELNVKEPTLVIDETKTNELKEIASSQVQPIVHQYRMNEKIVGPGEIVDTRIFSVLGAYGLIQIKSPWMPMMGIAVHVFLVMILLVIFAYQFSPEIFEKWRRLLLIGLLMFFVLAMGKAFLAINLGNSAALNDLTPILIPAAWVTMTVTILLGVRIAVVVGIVLAVFLGTMADPSSLGSAGSLAALFSLIGGLVGIQSVAKLDRRSDMATAGLYVALVNIALVSGVALITQLSLTNWLIGCILGVANGILSSILTMGTLPWLELGFNITSAVRLLELSNPNAPLLKSLLIEAPGTYHHSVLVGNLAETAAEVINADPVLVRVGALYHDIGKLKRPYFFIENQFSKDNPHDKIAPTLSSLIIISHVKDGLEMAKEHKLPEGIQDIISQHHGDSISSFFYHKAIDENPEIPEEAFRYDGQRPQSKEAALVLLADSVEAAVRSQKMSTPGKVEGLVRKVIKEKFDEGLLDQCDLTFKDLDKIAIAFVKVLSGIFHSRVEYPEFSHVKLKALEESQEKEVQEIEEQNQEDVSNDGSELTAKPDEGNNQK